MSESGATIRRVVYCSRATKPMDHATLMKILNDARAFNSMDDISGVLLHDRGNFLQVLEGPSEAVDNLLVTLKRDDRHEEVDVLSDILVSERLFPDWQMGFGDLADPALDFMPGIASDDERQNRIRKLADSIPELAKRLSEALD